jgi:hypothetical protein
MPLFNDGDLEVFATHYDPEPFAYVYRALLALYTPKLGFYYIFKSNIYFLKLLLVMNYYVIIK